MVAHISSPSSRTYLPVGPLLGIVAIATGVAGFAYLAGASQGKVPVPVERSRVFVPEFNAVDIPVPEKPVPAGVAVRDIPVRMEKFPEHQLPRGVVRDLSRVRDMVVVAPLPGGLPLIDSNLSAADEVANPVSGRIPEGMRAMTVRVDATSAVEGWARNGSVVDVLLVEADRTTVVAEKVKVLSTERSLSPVDEVGKAPIPNTVTILVTQEQCLAINTAVPLGKIALVLRSNRDSDSWRSTRFSAQELKGGGKGVEPSRIQGVAWFGSGADRKKFALVDGAWIPAAASAGHSKDESER